MCTAITYQPSDFYFGRTLDYQRLWGEEITIAPRNFPLTMRHGEPLLHHHAIIGIAHVAQGYPLFYDGINENGLSMAGLNFTGNAVYRPALSGKQNVAQFELIPRILGQFSTVEQFRRQVKNLNITDTPFSPELAPAQLHWIIADRQESAVLEATGAGLRLYPNPVGVLTNNPPFDFHLRNLENYLNITAGEAVNRFCQDPKLLPDSRGMGGIGLPGDLSSRSRFVRAAFTKLNSLTVENEAAAVGQFFHILDTVSQVRGCCKLDDNEYEITQYTVCYNAARGLCYHTTYGNRQITAVDLHREDLDGKTLIRYPLAGREQICFLN